MSSHRRLLLLFTSGPVLQYDILFLEMQALHYMGTVNEYALSVRLNLIRPGADPGGGTGVTCHGQIARF